MEVYAWGANSHGQLGLGYESELCSSPQRLPKGSFLPQLVRSIRGGGGHVLVLDSNGRVHACGWNNRGQLGLNSTELCHCEFQMVPTEFFEEVPIESISCGWDISGAITVNKRLYVWGSNAFQQLGICQRGFMAVRRPMPVRLPRDEHALRISFGLRHCAVLTEDNKIYVFGRLRIMDPSPIELAITSTSLNRAEVLKIQAHNPKELRIISLSSGQHHLLLKCLDLAYGGGTKRVVALGDNKFGQCNAFLFENDVRKLAVGWTHNAAVLKTNEILLWGRNCYGQLGVGQFSEQQALPTQLKIAEDKKPAAVHLGAEHGLLRTTTGEIYTWGWNEHGNCGNDSTENLCSPTLVKLPNCKLAGTGAGFCYAVCEPQNE
ncbi:secretion-regulating guanine nucleotide exchange factor [Scaptodrosophila lebanonensis]|uniref:Secretion-regulating guanine nucleotide exchange factor n=1 Tax=Drosophila lebanonensis TaxID=7225 RepID=A0A6J2U8J6_DROLE|nr:secretion-regulating guanine nucleotide exchange factor [Scaptodrosophila lebanonensis]